MISQHKTVQIAAYLLNKAKDRTMSGQKLVNLMYLADRKHLADHHYTIADDYYVARPSGPVPLLADALIRDLTRVEYWDKLIRRKRFGGLQLRQKLKLEDQTDLWARARKVMDQVFERFGCMNTVSELEPYTRSLKEYQQAWADREEDYPFPGITVRDIMEALGKSQETIQVSIDYRDALQAIYDKVEANKDKAAILK